MMRFVGELSKHKVTVQTACAALQVPRSQVLSCQVASGMSDRSEPFRASARVAT